MSDFTQMRKLAEQAMAEDKALRQQLAAAQERIAALENALRGMVRPYDGHLPMPGWLEQDDDMYCCNYCFQWSNPGAGYETIKHDADCPVAIAKALLEGGE